MKQLIYAFAFACQSTPQSWAAVLQSAWLSKTAAHANVIGLQLVVTWDSLVQERVEW